MRGPRNSPQNARVSGVIIAGASGTRQDESACNKPGFCCPSYVVQTDVHRLSLL